MLLVTVRYGISRMVANFTYPFADIKANDKVIVNTDNGTEVGRVDSPPQEVRPGDKIASSGSILRKMTPDDAAELVKINKEKIPQILNFAENKILEMKLDMKISVIDYVFGGEKVTFYFIAKGRIDFRELIKELGKEYKTRIEMKQIGVRDEARLLSDIGHCGQGLCCRSFIKETEAVTMKMAKNQKATLDPSKISGLCGRLMCCLRYEDDLYIELRAKLPRKGTIVKTKNGVAEVIDTEVLAQKVFVEYEDHTRIRIPLSDILEKVKEPASKVEVEEEKGNNGA